MREIGIMDYRKMRSKRGSTLRWDTKLKEFIRINSNPAPETDEEYNAASLLFLKQNHDDIHFALLNYMKGISENYLPGTVHNIFNTLKGWLKTNRYNIDSLEMEELKYVMPKCVTVTEDAYLTADIIKSILAHSDILMRAFILLSCSSGARIGEILQLETNSIKYWKDEDVYYFDIPYDKAKNQTGHRYYLSHEAYKEISEYLKIRNQYNERREKRSAKSLGIRVTHSNYLFEMRQCSIRRRMIRALEAAGLYSVDDKSRRTTIHPHSFRKFADTVFKEKLGVNMGNELIGHDEGLSSSYRRYDPKAVAQAYRKVEPFVTILAPADYVEIKEHISQDVDKIRAAMAAQALELVEIKERLQSTEQLLAWTLEDGKK